MKLLVNTPPLDRNGGVANFYRMLEPHFGPEVEFFTVAETVGGTSKKLFGAVADVFRYIRRLSRGGIDVCVFNPSLNRGAILRDAAYSFIAARLFRKPTAVFWHGWDLKYERKVQTSPLRRWRLRHSLFHAELMFVLAASFAERLKEWGYRGKVLTATTAIPREALAVPRGPSPRESQRFTVLFMSRIELAKGILTALEAYARAERARPGKFALIIAGAGGAEAEMRRKIAELGLNDVLLTGYVRGEDKLRLLARADCFLLPSFGEGMPCAVLEAMGAGLPVLVSRVGGLPDFFRDGEMGFMSRTNDAAEYASRLAQLADAPELCARIGAFNRAYAERHFAADIVAAFIVSSIKQYLHWDKESIS